MGMTRFWRQPCRRYRNFQVLAGALALALWAGALAALWRAPGPAWAGGLAAAGLGGLGLGVLGGQLNLRACWAGLGPAVGALAAAGVVGLLMWARAPGAAAWGLGGLGAWAAAAALVGSAGLAWLEIEDYGGDDDLVPGLVASEPGGWTRMERRWAEALLEAIVPAEAPGGGLQTVGTRGAWGRLMARAPRQLRWGMRGAVWGAQLWALVGERRPFHRLGPEAQQRWVAEAVSSRWFGVRQIVLTLKMLACFVYFEDPRVREATR